MKRLQKILIANNLTLKDALKSLEKNKKRFLIVVDKNNLAQGTLVDGDIRRALINNATLEDPIKKHMNLNFEYITLQSDFDIVCDKFKIKKIDFLPVLDNGKIINVITKQQFHILLLENIKIDLMDDFSKYDKFNLEHEIYNKPWGFYKSSILTTHAQSKIITVFPKGELSLQEHKKREEHWVIIKGSGVVVIGESEILAQPGKHFFIPKGCKHRIVNVDEKENLIFAEVQLGDYFGEDDIIRYSDKYNRV